MTPQELRRLYYSNYKRKCNPPQTARNINRKYGDKTTTERTVRRWFRKFDTGVINFKDQEGRGRPNRIDNAALKAFVDDDAQKSVRAMANIFHVSKSTILRHLKELGMEKKDGKWVTS